MKNTKLFSPKTPVCSTSSLYKYLFNSGTLLKLIIDN